MPTASGFLYLAVVLDAWSRKIVGWSMANYLRTELVLDALEMAIGKHGGLTNTRKVATIAEAAGLSLFGDTMLESGVGTAASAQLFSTLPTLRRGCQLFGPLLFNDDIAANRPEYRDFDLVVPNGPGFGVVVDEDKLAFYRRDGGRRAGRLTTGYVTLTGSREGGS